MESVWKDVVVSDESLVQCIADIRRVVGADAKNLIETIPREGYKLHVQTKEAAPDATSRNSSFIFLFVIGIVVVVYILFSQYRSSLQEDSPSPFVLQVSTDKQKSQTHDGPENIPAYLELLQGRVSANRFDKTENLVAERHFRRAIELDPKYARAYAELAVLLAVRFENNWDVLETADMEKALFYAERSLQIDPNLWLAHYSLGRVNSMVGKFEKAEVHLKQAMSLQPDNEDARAYYGVVLNLQGAPEVAVEILEPTLKSHPNPPYWYHLALGHAQLMAGQYEAAEKHLKECLKITTDSPYCLRYLIALYGEQGRVKDAAVSIRLYEAQGFEPTVTAIGKTIRNRPTADRLRFENAVRAAGMKD